MTFAPDFGLNFLMFYSIIKEFDISYLLMSFQDLIYKLRSTGAVAHRGVWGCGIVLKITLKFWRFSVLEGMLLCF